MPQVQTPGNRGRSAPAAVPPNLGPTRTWVKVANAFTFAAFSAAATTNTIPVFFLPAAAIISGIKIFPKTSFSGPGITGYTISVGDGTLSTAYADAFNVFQATGPLVYSLASNFGGESLVAATQIYATATSTGANLSAATAGIVDILAEIAISV
jgi:hypothetical protein